MPPVQVYLAMRKRSLNLNSRKAAIAFAYPRDLGRQTGGLRQVVSGYAVGNGDTHRHF